MRYLFVIIFVTGCVGIKFNNKNNRNIEFESKQNQIIYKLILKDSSIFEYCAIGHMRQVTSKGKFYISNNNIYLLSFEEYRSGYCLLKGCEKLKTQDSILLTVKDTINLPFAFAGIQINDKPWRTLDIDGKVFIKNDSLIKINISFLGIVYSCSSELKTKSPEEVILIPFNANKIFFNNERWQIKVNRVKLLNQIWMYRKRR